MYTSYPRILLFIGVLSATLCLPAQNKNEGVKLLCSPRADSILLRWAPTNPAVWRLGNRYGYSVVRFTVLQNKKIPKDIPQILLTSEPLRPRPIAEWEAYADDKYAAVAAECIFAEDDKGQPQGGTPAAVYQKYKVEQQRYSFALYAADQSRLASRLSGLYFADKTALPNEKYLYRVYINCPDSLAVDTAFAFTGLDAHFPLPKPLDLRAEWTDQKVQLRWPIAHLAHIYNSYVLEKSADGGRTFFPLGENAMIQLADENVTPGFAYKSDTLDSNLATYHYRVRGIDSFGEKGPPSDSISGCGTLPLDKAPVPTRQQVIDNRHVLLEWDYPPEMNPYTLGFRLYRSASPNGAKQLIWQGNAPAQRSYTDTVPYITNYYLLSAYNATREKFSSTQIYAERVDSFPPLPPQLLTGRIDSTGQVTVTWTRNHEDDLEGYRVYKSNHPDYEFTLASPAVLRDTVFRDSVLLRTLTKQIYYKVTAVDVRQNQSDMSDMLALARPDVVPPLPPRINGITDAKGKPAIEWGYSPSDDVGAYLFYRKEKNDTLFAPIGKVPFSVQGDTRYVDLTALAGKAYIYQMRAEDYALLYSQPSNSVFFQMQGKVAEAIKLKRKTLIDRVELTWQITSDKPVTSVLIYRATENEPLRLYDHGTPNGYTDTKLSPGKTYRYAVKAVYGDGSSSGLSPTVNARM
ncbi:MAG: hypothetical protein QM786_06755 [Breznakibacter sp.]